MRKDRDAALSCPVEERDDTVSSSCPLEGAADDMDLPVAVDLNVPIAEDNEEALMEEDNEEVLMEEDEAEFGPRVLDLEEVVDTVGDQERGHDQDPESQIIDAVR